MESNKDYYYVKQNVTLKMGGSPKIFHGHSENIWSVVANYGDYNRWYGTFLSQYETSMNLTGSGNIYLEASVPSTDNNSQTTNITTSSSTSRTETIGISVGGTFGENPAFNLGGSYSVGTTTSKSFSMSMSQTHKDLSVKKNTSGNKVTWTYNGTLPKYYAKLVGNTWWNCHQEPADILVNDCDLSDEICWSVSNPSGQYTVEITSAPQRAALLFSTSLGSIGNRPSKYEYTTAPTANYTHTLIEPNRAIQKWRMFITIEGDAPAGALGDLVSDMLISFPDLYASEFTVADKTSTSLNTIKYVVNYSKQLFEKNIDILQSYAKDAHVSQFTIHWRCDDKDVQTREGFTVKVD